MSILDIIVENNNLGLTSGIFGQVFMPIIADRVYFVFNHNVINQYELTSSIQVSQYEYIVVIERINNLLQIYSNDKLIYRSVNKIFNPFIHINNKLIPKKKLHIISTFEPYRCAIEYIGSFKKFIDYELIIYDKEIELANNPENIYLFIQSIPENILKNSMSNVKLLNIEQLTRENYKNMIKDYQTKNIDIVDYVIENTQISKSTYVLPYLHSVEIDHLTNILSVTKKQYDFCHVGGLSPKRLKVIQSLIEKGYTVNIINTWGDTRDHEIAKAEILLNIHYTDDYKIYESLRCDRWAYSGMKVISEECEYIELNDMVDIIKFSPYDSIVSDAIDMLNKDHWLDVNQKASAIGKISIDRDKLFLDNIERLFYS